jgi:hypothetical protein
VVIGGDETGEVRWAELYCYPLRLFRYFYAGGCRAHLGEAMVDPPRKRPTELSDRRFRAAL